MGTTEEAARETAQKNGYGDKVAVVKTSFKANSKVGLPAAWLRPPRNVESADSKASHVAKLSKLLLTLPNVKLVAVARCSVLCASVYPVSAQTLAHYMHDTVCMHIGSSLWSVLHAQT